MSILFKGVPGPGEFLSSPSEWHSFIIGFFEVVVPWPPFIKRNDPLANFILSEYHYYLFGRFLGLPVLIAWLYLVYIMFRG